MKGEYDGGHSSYKIYMITNINKKVICLKDIPSNIIEEAIFILKTDVSKKPNEKTQLKRRELATKEAEYILNDYIEQMKKDELEHRKRINSKKDKNKIFIAIVGAIIFCYIISLL